MKLFDGRFELESKLGEGRFARVYAARNLETDAHIPDGKFALKIFKSTHDWSLTTKAGNRLFEEASMLEGLEHKHVVKIYDARFTQSGDRFYLVLQYLEGDDLQDLIKESALSWKQTLRILGGVVEALGYLHSLNIVHGDVKPSNIIVDTKSDWAYLVDFGLAHIIGYDKYKTQTGTGVPGTLHYMAPELWDEHPPTRSSDIYALATTVYEMLTGEKLFQGTLHEMMMGHCERLPDLSAVEHRGAPEEIVNVLSKALDKSPSNRYTSVDAFYQDIQGHRNSVRNVRQWGVDDAPSNITVEQGVWETNLRVNTIQDVLVQKSHVWAATDMGLVHWNTLTHKCKLLHIGNVGGKRTKLLALAVDKHGNLWIASECGLMWGYGSSFRSVPALDSIEVRDVLVAHDGSVWAATAQGIVRLDRKGENPKWFTDFGSISSVNARALYQSRFYSRIWVGLTQAIAYFDGYRWHITCSETENVFSGSSILAITGTFDGRIWAVTSKGLLLYKHRKWIEIDSATLASVGPIRSVLPDTKESFTDSVWLGGQQGLFHYHDGTITPCSNAIQNVQSMFQKDDGWIVVATDEGVVDFSPQMGIRSTLNLPDAPLANNLNSIVVDKHQNKIWVGGRKGISCFDRTVWHHYPTSYRYIAEREGPGRGSVLALDFSAVDASLWVITREGGLRFFRQGNWHIVNIGSLIAGRPRSLFAAADGVVWVGLEAGLGRVTVDNREQVSLVTGVSSPITALTEYAGKLWVGTCLGMFVYSREGDLLREPQNEREGLFSHEVLSLRCTYDRLLWAGTDHGAACFNGTHWSFFPDLEGCKVFSVFQSQDHALWFGTAEGLCRYDGKVLSWIREDRAPHISVRSLAQTDDGCLWIVTENGLMRFTPSLRYVR